MKKLFLFLATMMLPLLASANNVKVDGICYELMAKGHLAKVVFNTDDIYSGEIVIPETFNHEGETYTVVSIGASAFACASITSVVIPNTVTSIEELAFYYCQNLRSITFGNGLQTVSYQAFDDCSAIESIYISDIAAWCKIEFNKYGRSNPLFNSDLYLNGELVTDLIIPADVTYINKSAFEACNSITSVTIPGSIQSMGPYVFSGCKNLVSANFENGVTFVGNNIFTDCVKLKSVKLSNTITTIGEGAFTGCSSLEKVELSNSITTIGEWALSRCSSLEKIGIPNSILNINKGAFSECKSLTNIVIPQNICAIGNSAFYNCEGLQSITIRACDNLRSIGEDAFGRCQNLEDFYCFSNHVPNANENAFRDSYIEYATLHVKSNLVTEYGSASPWNKFEKIVPINSDDTETPKCATPTITYENGELKMSCDTEGVVFVTDITDTDIKRHYDTNIKLSATYVINVYATKTGYDNSDIATATLCWLDGIPNTEDVTTTAAQISARPILVKTDNNVITINGIDDNTNVNVFTVDGRIVGSSLSQNNTITIPTYLQSGTIVIVKIGEKSIKTIMR